MTTQAQTAPALLNANGIHFTDDDGFLRYMMTGDPRAYATFGDWLAAPIHPGKIGPYLASLPAAQPGGWMEKTWRTIKAHPNLQFIAKPLGMPEALAWSDVVEEVRFCAKSPGKGWAYISDSGRGFLGLPSSVGAKRSTRADGVRCSSGGERWSLFAKPRPEVVAWWESVMGPIDDREWGLTCIEAVRRDDGVLLIGNCPNSIGRRWAALLDHDSTPLDLLSPEDRAVIVREKEAEAEAWPPVQAPVAEPARDGGNRKQGHLLVIGSDVMAVLAAGRVEEDRFYLPPGQLPRDLYTATDAALKLAGGRWDRRAKAHIFPEPAEPILDRLLTTGAVNDDKTERQAFYTPAALAARVVEQANIRPGMKVLEPSAGGGALLGPIVAAGANVWAYEIDKAARDDLVSRFFAQFGAGGCVAGDFLAVEPDEVFDRIVMNPPFTKQADARHVLHAFRFLKPGGRLVAIMSGSAPHRATGPGADLLALVAQCGGIFDKVEAGAFKESGTMVETVILTLDKPQ